MSRWQCRRGVLATIALLTLPGLASGVSSARALTLQQPGYVAALLKDLSAGSYDRMDIDDAGTLFLTEQSGGILKVTSAGATSPWSSAFASDLTLMDSGDGYGAGSGQCHCIFSLSTSGAASTLHQDSMEWLFVAITPDSVLYAVGQTLAGMGLYSIDRSTGQPNSIVVGGPGVGGTGWYSGLTVGQDGQLYVLGTVDGSVSGSRLFRLDGGQLTNVASVPHFADDVTAGPAGLFLVTSVFDYGSGYQTGELWRVDPVSGTNTLLALSGSYPGLVHPTLDAVGYDPLNKTIYVTEGWKLWTIKPDQTAASPTSWGSVKATYRN